MTSKIPLPTFYYLFFTYLEPSLSLIGAYLYIFNTEQYALDLIPSHLERLTNSIGNTIRGRMVISGLGSCFFLLAMISFSMFPLMKKHLGSYPSIQEKLVRGLLIPLAIADIIHIVVTILPLPMSHLNSPSDWTVTLHGNVTITAILFITRSAWFLGIGRHTSSTISSGSGKRRKSHGQTNLPLPPSSSPKSSELGKKVAEIEVGSPKRRSARSRKSDIN